MIDFPLNDFFLPSNLNQDSAILLQDERTAFQLKEEQEEARLLREKQDAESDVIDAEPIEYYQQTNFDLIQPIDEWIEQNCYDYTTVHPTTLSVAGAQKIKLTDKQRRILRHIFTPKGNSISRYITVIWSEPKKEGKTTIASCVVAYFAENVDPPNNILCIANKKDQAEGRIYRGAKPSLKALGGKVPVAANSKPIITMLNGTTIRALPNTPATEAGDSYCLTAWSEIWAFKSEDDERLFSELMPTPTRRVSMRWIETYSGYWDESNTLKRIFLKAFTNQDEKELAEGARFVPELTDIRTDNRPACVEIPDEKLFIYWSHENDAPWKDQDYIRIAKKDLTKVEAVRLIENRWQNSISDLLEEAWIQASVRERDLDRFKGMQFTLAVDASQRWDNISLVGTFKQGETYYTPLIEIHDPKGQDADLHELVEKRVKALFDEGCLLSYWEEGTADTPGRWITPVYFDPYQLHQIRLNCIAYGIDVKEFNQGAMRTLADTMLYELYRDSKIVNPMREDFFEHLRGGKAKYLEGEKVRIQKGTTQDAKKIDALVAQSMSCYGTFLIDQLLLSSQDSGSTLAQDSMTGWGFGAGAKEN